MKKDPDQLRLKDISIRKPCSENWQEMDHATGGRFCGHCQKQVIDFTDKTDEDLRRIVAEQGSRLCGRFYRSQIGEPAVEREKRKGMGDFFKKAAATAATLAIMGTTAQAADPPAKPRTEISDNTSIGNPDPSSPNTVVTGLILTDYQDNIPDDIKVQLVYQTAAGRKTLEQYTHAGLFHFNLSGKALPNSPIVVVVPAQTLKDGHMEHKYPATRHAATLAEGQNILVEVKVEGLWDDIIMGDMILDPDE